MNGCRILATTVLLMLIFSMTAAGVETTNVTIGVNEYIVLNNDIYIELLDVSVDMMPYAKVWFYSYQDPIGIQTTLYLGGIFPPNTQAVPV